MSALVDADVLQPGRISATVAMPRLERARPSATEAGGVTMELPSVGGDASPVDPATEPTPTRRLPPGVARALPLATVAAIGAAVLTALVVQSRATIGSATLDEETVEASAERVVALEPTVAIIGLNDDNKEAVLTLCWHVSSNPTHECRLSYLESTGEYPHREVAFGALDVDAYEVSNARYEACVAAGDCTPRALDDCRFHTIYRHEFGQPVPEALLQPNHPASCVTAEQARAFCASRGMRLPTSEEWERIARSGDDRMQPWGPFWTPAILNWGERDMVGFPVAGRLDGAELTASVDDYADGRTDEGVYNMFGNVAEWVEPLDDDPDGTAGIRGGSYIDDALDLRMTRHAARPADRPRSDVGFRCVADAPR